jgi:hypothetical protein
MADRSFLHILLRTVKLRQRKKNRSDEGSIIGSITDRSAVTEKMTTLTK